MFHRKKTGVPAGLARESALPPGLDPGRNFLVTGLSGAGKTHFLRDLVKTQAWGPDASVYLASRAKEHYLDLFSRFTTAQADSPEQILGIFAAVSLITSARRDQKALAEVQEFPPVVLVCDHLFVHGDSTNEEQALKLMFPVTRLGESVGVTVAAAIPSWSALSERYRFPFRHWQRVCVSYNRATGANRATVEPVGRAA